MSEIKINIDKFINGAFQKKVENALNDVCQVIENDAKELCPVDDGVLSASLTHRISKKSNTFTGEIGTNIEYAPYVHEGTGIYAKNGDGRKDVPWRYKGADGKVYQTVGQKPNPFLQDAFDKNIGDIKEYFKGLF